MRHMHGIGKVFYLLELVYTVAAYDLVLYGDIVSAILIFNSLEGIMRTAANAFVTFFCFFAMAASVSGLVMFDYLMLHKLPRAYGRIVEEYTALKYIAENSRFGTQGFLTTVVVTVGCSWIAESRPAMAEIASNTMYNFALYGGIMALLLAVVMLGIIWYMKRHLHPMQANTALPQTSKDEF